jgi:sec-independent protein translocase protein TatA
MPFGLQPLDILVIVVVALVIFGPKRLPQLGRWLGKTFSAFKKGAQDMADGFTEETASRTTATPVAPAPGSTGQESTREPAGNQKPAVEPSPYAEAAAGQFCTACGAANAADARFCNKCGTRLAT